MAQAVAPQVPQFITVDEVVKYIDGFGPREHHLVNHVAKQQGFAAALRLVLTPYALG